MRKPSHPRTDNYACLLRYVRDLRVRSGPSLTHSTAKMLTAVVAHIIRGTRYKVSHKVVLRTCKLAVNPSDFAEVGNPGISTWSNDSGLSMNPATAKLILQRHAQQRISSSYCSKASPRCRDTYACRAEGTRSRIHSCGVMPCRKN